jgi:hypothetical protein
MKYMKLRRAKMLLALISLLTIISGFISFKTTNHEFVIYTHKSTDPTTKCTVPVVGYTTLVNLFPTYFCATTSPTLPCTCKTWYLTD